MSEIIDCFEMHCYIQDEFDGTEVRQWTDNITEWTGLFNL